MIRRTLVYEQKKRNQEIWLCIKDNIGMYNVQSRWNNEHFVGALSGKTVRWLEVQRITESCAQ